MGKGEFHRGSLNTECDGTRHGDGGIERQDREPSVSLYQHIRARGMPRRVSINSRRGANSCRWNAR